MADDNGQKTEKPTPKRLAEARRQGQIPRSPDLTGWLVVLVSTWLLPALVGRLARELRTYMAEMAAAVGAHETEAFMMGTGRLIPRLVVAMAPYLAYAQSQGMAAVLLNADPPDHVRQRKLVNAAFRPRRLAALEPFITDVAGLRVGNADDSRLASGVTAIVFDEPAVGSIDIRGGGPGTRETALLDPAQTVSGIDAITLSGGSAFGLDAAGGHLEDLAVGEHGDLRAGGRRRQQDERDRRETELHRIGILRASEVRMVPSPLGTEALTSTTPTTLRRVRRTSSASPLLLVKIGAPALSKNSVSLSSSSTSKVTATLGTGFPDSPKTVAITWVEFDSMMREGTARSRMAVMRTLPIRIGSASWAVTAPENAVMVAVPDRLSDTKRAVATPRRVRVSGSMRPRSVVQRTTVPSGT